LGVQNGNEIVLSIDGMTFTFPVLVRNGIPKGMAGLPVGLGLPYLSLPMKGKINAIKK
jgi:anaerobic selenocysteine-containing dehydrogenase